MRHLLICLFVFLLIPIVTISQANNWLIHKFKNADSVLLISHKLTAGSTDVAVDNKGNQIVLPELIIEGKLNLGILTEKQIINGKQIDRLLKILKRHTRDSVINQGGCFVPRQSIIIVKNHKISFIDICFHCNSYKLSKDLKNIPAFDNLKWRQLREYFTKLKLTYKLEKQLD